MNQPQSKILRARNFMQMAAVLKSAAYPDLAKSAAELAGIDWADADPNLVFRPRDPPQPKPSATGGAAVSTGATASAPKPTPVAKSWAQGIVLGRKPETISTPKAKESVAVAEPQQSNVEETLIATGLQPKTFVGAKEGRFHILRNTMAVNAEGQVELGALKLIYYDDHNRPYFTFDCAFDRSGQMHIWLMLFSSMNGGSRWKEPQHYSSYEEFVAYCKSWYGRRPDDDEKGVPDMDTMFLAENIEKVVLFDKFSEEEVKHDYTKIGAFLRRIVLHLCQGRDFVNAKGKTIKNKYKPMKEGQVRNQRGVGL